MSAARSGLLSIDHEDTARGVPSWIDRDRWRAYVLSEVEHIARCHRRAPDRRPIREQWADLPGTVEVELEYAYHSLAFIRDERAVRVAHRPGPGWPKVGASCVVSPTLMADAAIDAVEYALRSCDRHIRPWRHPVWLHYTEGDRWPILAPLRRAVAPLRRLSARHLTEATWWR